MHISRFIAQHLAKQQQSNFTVLISRIAIGSIAVGLAVVLLSFMIFNGFRATIQDKIFSVAAHLQLTKYTLNNSYEEQPLSTQRPIFSQYNQIDENLQTIHSFTQKPALMRTKEDIAGVVMKGFGNIATTHPLQSYVVSGRFVSTTPTDSIANEVLISEYLANLLDVKVADKVFMYFIQEPPKVRKLSVVGIYKTDIEEFDKKMVFCQEKLLQDVNEWQDTLVGGYELMMRDFDKLPIVEKKVFDAMNMDMQLINVTDKFAHFFDWFVMLNRNVIIFLSIIVFVASFNTVSILLILILERTNMIGIFKALGASHQQIQQIFWYQGLQIVWKGMLWGNGIGLGLAWLQYQFHLIPLDAATYYMDTAPIYFDWLQIMAINIGVVLLLAVVMYLPTQIITRISPIKAIRFD
jgi:lipoprotein-releasing system permease protein